MATTNLEKLYVENEILEKTYGELAGSKDVEVEKPTADAPYPFVNISHTLVHFGTYFIFTKNLVQMKIADLVKTRLTLTAVTRKVDNEYN